MAAALLGALRGSGLCDCCNASPMTLPAAVDLVGAGVGDEVGDEVGDAGQGRELGKRRAHGSNLFSVSWSAAHRGGGRRMKEGKKGERTSG